MGLNRSGGYLTDDLWNQNIDALELMQSTSVGRGVVSGLELTNGGGLTLAISAGSMSSGLLTKSYGSATYTLPNNTTVYVWRHEDGTFSTSVASTDLGSGYVRLGRVTTGAATITTITAEGRMSVGRWTDFHTFVVGENAMVLDTLNKRVAFGTTPATGKVLTISGDVSFTGGQLGVGNTSTIMVGTLTLTSSSANVQVVTASGADRKIVLPSPGPELWFDVVNVGATYDVWVRDPADANTVGVVRPGERMEFRPVGSGGSTVWGVSRLGSELWRDAVSVSGTATPVSLNWETVYSATVPFWALSEVNRSLKGSLRGTMTKSGGGTSPTVKWRLTLGGVLLAESYATPYSGVGVLTDVYWAVDWDAAVVTAGASGVLRTSGHVFVPNSSGGNLIPVPLSLPAATGVLGPGTTADSAAVDLTADQTLKLETQLSAATAGNQQTLRAGRVAVLAI